MDFPVSSRNGRIINVNKVREHPQIIHIEGLARDIRDSAYFISSMYVHDILFIT